jgi:hypothetical protein
MTVGAIFRDMIDTGWIMIAFGYLRGLAYEASMCVYQIGILIITASSDQNCCSISSDHLFTNKPMSRTRRKLY